MKTLTEFSPLVLRKAAEALAKARAEAPAKVEAAAPPPEGDAPDAARAEAAPAEAAPAEAAPAEAAPEGEQPASAPATEHAAAADPIANAVAAALNVQPDRAARLIEALDIIGDRLDHVRLVRVFQGEKGPHDAISRGEFHYSIDRVAAPKRGRDRDDRRDDRRGGGGGGGGGGRGGRDRDKPRGLGSLKVGAAKEERDPRDDRPGRGEMPRAGIGWQLTAAPRDFEGRGGGRGRGPKRGGPRRGPGGPGGPGGPRGDRGPGGPGREWRGEGRGPGRGRGPNRGPRDLGPPREGEHSGAPEGVPHHGPHEGSSPMGAVPQERAPRLGPDGQPLPPRQVDERPKRKRPRKPIGPDANGLGPDGTPWDPERRAKKLAERAEKPPEMNSQAPASVESAAPSPAPETPTE